MSGNKIKKITEIIILVLENSSLPTNVQINEHTLLRDDLGFDSLALAELAVRIEDEFDVDVFEDGLVNTLSEILQKL
jgi:acyl carrier protein